MKNNINETVTWLQLLPPPSLPLEKGGRSKSLSPSLFSRGGSGWG
jgi:hypothetical protein